MLRPSDKFNHAFNKYRQECALDNVTIQDPKTGLMLFKLEDLTTDEKWFSIAVKLQERTGYNMMNKIEN